MTTFNWLHITDLHLSMEASQRLWPNVEEDFFEDLEFLVERVGSLDLVLFTGDFVYKGISDEYDLVNDLLSKLWAMFLELGSRPKLLAVPGNHDLARPEDIEDPALINLQYLWDRQVVQNPFWNNADSEQRRIVDKAFADYTAWWDNLLIPKPRTYRRGVLSGDFSATIEKDGRKLGILGLNTSFLQLQGGNSQGNLAVDVRQFHEACGGHGPDWARKHDACLLLTHHPPSWLKRQDAPRGSGQAGARP